MSNPDIFDMNDQVVTLKIYLSTFFREIVSS